MLFLNVFEVGLRDKKESVSIRRWFKAVDIDPRVGLKDFLLKHISVRQLVEPSSAFSV